MFKTNTVITCLLVLASAAGSAQCTPGQYELSAGWGRLPSGEIGHSIIPQGGSGGQAINHSAGAVSATARVYLSRVAVGISYGYNYFGGYAWNSYGYRVLSFSDAHHTIDVECTLLYRNHRFVRTYGYIGMGIALKKERTDEGSEMHIENKTGLNVEVVPLGVAIGGRFSGFAELGISYKGLVNIGFSYRFARQKKKDVPET